MNKQTIHIILSIILILNIGFFGGYLFGYKNAQKKYFPDIQKVEDVNPGITTVHLIKVQNGILEGKIMGRKGRIVYRPEDILELDKGDDFSIPLNDIQMIDNFYVSENLPDNTLFIASKNGKYYYSILDKQAFSITPKNRLYFNSSQEAEKAGYQSK